MKEQGLCCGLMFLPTHFFAKSTPVATSDQVTDAMFGPRWNLYSQTLEIQNLGSGNNMDGQKDVRQTISKNHPAADD